MKLKYTGTGPVILKDDDGREYGKVMPGAVTPELPNGFAETLLKSQPSNFSKVKTATKNDSPKKEKTS